MGYYVTYNIKASFKRENEPAMLAAINALHDPEVMNPQSRGGSWEGGKQTCFWYAFTDNPPPGGFTTLDAALKAWRFEADNYAETSAGLCFNGDKLGQEEILFATLAPYLTGDIYASGEDGFAWGYRFRDGKLINLNCKWVEDES